ncbi:site-specific tyrosine recombinase/integron integrase [Clostridium botulinum]|uniref:Integrase n=1 Tax=Clostridium botulinum TaxID=1491 RepID=A0A0L9YAJ1_CLOBO|nr:site-specific tyrosine recombinase/integron integrase [Clostridium botulinum]KAI3350805.1 tyrosine-type recombinase/integrase [Clostridium botulinum]KOM88795.1 integrase [Clostridium botulinum]KOR57632.1 integrase [Clostridium botulinum]NFE58202.1 integrase [Clostridium botulinum]NFE94538.1 integrase [Clostridium botulinum]
MNCNEEFVIKTIGKLTLEFNLNWEQQKIVRDCLYYSLYNYEVVSKEKSLIKGDMPEKILLYLSVKKLAGYSAATLKNYKYLLDKLAYFLNKPVTTITVNDIRMFLVIQGKGKKPSTINSIIFYIKAFFNWLESEDLITKNPVKKLEINKLPKRLRKALTLEELERLRIACKTNRERALLEFLFSTGCRVTETVDCNITDLNFNENILKVVGKGDKERIVCFGEKTKLYLKKYIYEDRRKDNDPALFVSEKFPYKRLSKRGIELIISKLGKRADFNKNIFPHLLRHTMATVGLQNGANLITIQQLLGHTDPATTQIYAQNSIENIKYEYKQHMNF